MRTTKKRRYNLAYTSKNHYLYIPVMKPCHTFLFITLLLFAACTHNSHDAISATPTPAPPSTAAATTATSYIIVDTSYGQYEQELGYPDTVINYYHTALHDSMNIAFDTARTYLIYRNDTFTFNQVQSPGDTLYWNTQYHFGFMVDLINVTADSINISHLTQWGHSIEDNAVLHGYKVH